MTVSEDGAVIRLQGQCRVEDAEVVTALLLNRSEPLVDLSGCESMHAAVFQVLLAFRPRIVGRPENAFIRDRLLPALAG